MPTIRLIKYDTEEYKWMVQLRDDILRKPLGLRFTEEYLQQEKEDILIGCFQSIKNNKEEIIGCCILTPVGEENIQLRQMAVITNLQRKGIGKIIIQFAEEEARKRKFKLLVIHARQSAIAFYEQLGYKVYGDEFLEINIPHFKMRKFF